MVRALLNVDSYSASPLVVFALLAPPSLEPECAMNMAALRLLRRFANSPTHASQLQIQLSKQQSFDGPFARAQQLQQSPIYGPVVQALAQQAPLPPSWQHDLRERWRKDMWKLVLRDRSQDYHGVGSGVNRELTVSLVGKWTEEADTLQCLLDMGLTVEPATELDPRPRLKILRLLLTGGLMDPERDRRHRRKAEPVKCQCGAIPSHDHITWHCPRLKALRAPALAALPRPLRTLPVCFKRTTVVPSTLAITEEALHSVQKSLVDVWQRHIQEWHSAEDVATFTLQPSAPATAVPVPANVPVEKRGHVLKPTASGGIFCCKCGRQTQYIKHVRLKITKTPCPNAALPPDRWLSVPGRMNAESRLDDLFRHMDTTFNKGIHVLVWNRRTGKDPADTANFGQLFCKICGSTWPWRRRHQCFRHAVCQPVHPFPTPPSWVSSMPALHHESRDSNAPHSRLVSDAAPAHDATANANPAARLRLRRKTAKPQPRSEMHSDAQNIQNLSSTPGTLQEIPSSSSVLPRVGVG